LPTIRHCQLLSTQTGNYHVSSFLVWFFETDAFTILKEAGLRFLSEPFTYSPIRIAGTSASSNTLSVGKTIIWLDLPLQLWFVLSLQFSQEISFWQEI